MLRFRSWRAILPLLLAALAMRAIVPSGWMLDETADGALQVRICSPLTTTVEPAKLMTGMDHAAVGHSSMMTDDAPAQPHHPSGQETMDGLCAFAVAGAQALGAVPPDMGQSPRSAALALASWQAAGAPRIALRLKPPGRAPPVRA